MTTLTILAGLIAVIAWLLLRPLAVLSADAQVAFAASQETREYDSVAADITYKGGFVGVNPAGYAGPLVPGLTEFAGICTDTCDNSAGAAGAKKVKVRTTGDFEFALSGVGIDDRGKPVYATDDATLSLTGHALAYVGRIVNKLATDTALVRLRAPGEEAPNIGSFTHKLSGHEALEPTGATAGDGWLGPWEYETILGPGFVNNDEEDGGFELEFDATAEVALSSLRTPNDIFPVDKGLRLSFDLNITDNGDAGAIDLDAGFGTALTTNSEANIDHADMVQLIALHVDGNSLNLLVQSDNNTTDVANTDSTIDYAEGTAIHVDVCVSPAGLGKIYIDGVDAGDATHANVTLQVLSTSLLAAFINVEKTSDDTTFRAVARNIVLTAGATN